MSITYPYTIYCVECAGNVFELRTDKPRRPGRNFNNTKTLFRCVNCGYVRIVDNESKEAI